MSTIAFANGEPVAPADSNASYTDVFANEDNSACPKGCFRPVGMAFDSQGRLFVSSDLSGEIYIIIKDATSNNASSSEGGSSEPSSGGDNEASGAHTLEHSFGILLLALLFACLSS